MPYPFGHNIKLDICGGSHDSEISMTFSGLPAGIAIDTTALQAFMARRAPGQNAWSTPRREADVPEFLSGVTAQENGILVTDGTPIRARILNTNTRPCDYNSDTPRPGHADLAARLKYGRGVDLRGGGHFSGRLTALTCLAGGICLQYLRTKGIAIGAHVDAIDNRLDDRFDPIDNDPAQFDQLHSHAFPTLSVEAGERMQARIAEVHAMGDSAGGAIECKIAGVPAGLGEHMFRSVESVISQAIWSIPGVKAIAFGAGSAVTTSLGSQNNDPICTDGERIYTTTNNAGGVLGGMTYGMPICFIVSIKPTPSIAGEQQSISFSRMENTTLRVGGRHDPCIVPRAVPVVEAAAALAIMDLLLDE